ncbi:hypothetical protein D1BOALGB6SA_2309 [Olavius sp. associated proteobacterium Delta 1]|nr:hypothetical protein D1BOALGB6SA_2309 [Olavius sp. associated proteobacterium Delta 1]
MLERILQYRLRLILIFSLVLFVSGCETAYYGTMEKLGYHKRDLMVNRVESARDAQEDAKEQFESALEKFSSVLQFDGGDLEDKYDQLKRSRCIYQYHDERMIRLRIPECGLWILNGIFGCYDSTRDYKSAYGAWK